VTRPVGQAQSFITEIEHLGGQPFHLPTIEIVYTRCIPLLGDPDLIVFTSVNSVIGAQLDKAALKHKKNQQPLIAAIGTATANALHDAGVHSILSPAQNGNSETLLNLLNPHIKVGMKVTIVRGDSGRDQLRDGLQNLGARVRYEQAYERKLPETTDQEYQWKQANPDIVSISSDLGLVNLMKLLPGYCHQKLLSTPLVVNSKRCMMKANAAGFTADMLVADPPGDRGQISKLQEYSQYRT